LRAPVTHSLTSGSITISHPAATARAARAMLVYGLAVSPIDITPVPTATSASTTPSVSTGVSSTTKADELILGVFGYEEGVGFTATTPGVSGTSIIDVSGSGTTYTVTVNTGTGSGTIRLDVVDLACGILDSDNYQLGGTGAGNGNFSTGELYTICRTTPTISA